MKRFVRILVVIALSASLYAENAQGSAALHDEFRSLRNKYNQVSPGMRGAKSDLDRKAAVERMSAFAPRFLDLADRSGRTPIAIQALREAVQVIGSTDSGAQIAWEMNQSDFPAGSSDQAVKQVVDLVRRDHLRSNELAPVIDRMRYGYRIEFDPCMSAVLEENPHREVRAVTCLSLAQFLHDRLRMHRLLEDRPELARCYETVFGPDYLSSLNRLKRDSLEERILALYRRAAEEFGDVDVDVRGGTVGEFARSGLYEIQFLSVGKLAPDIAGRDEHGMPMQLSDYRGNVVLLYFWSEY